MVTKPKVIGLYGISGSGKSHLLNRLRRLPSLNDKFQFQEGSQLIAELVFGGVPAFLRIPHDKREELRTEAIENFWKRCLASSINAVVAGHLMLWPESKPGSQVGPPQLVDVHTQADLDIYTHIIYLATPISLLARRRAGDGPGFRPDLPIEKLAMWQRTEMALLRSLCDKNEILFAVVSDPEEALRSVETLLLDFLLHDEEHNRQKVIQEAQSRLGLPDPLIERILIIDADRTLAPVDTGLLFWTEVSTAHSLPISFESLKAIFSGPLGYSYEAFRQATLLYEEAADEQTFDSICVEVSRSVHIHPIFVSYFQMLKQSTHTKAIVMDVWPAPCLAESVGARGTP